MGPHCLPRSIVRHLSGSASPDFAASPLRPDCPSLPLLLVWMNVSSLTSWLSRLPCSSIFCQFWLVFVFKLLLSFFWLCKEAQCVYLCLHLGQNSLLILEREDGREGEREVGVGGEKHRYERKICSLSPMCTPTRDRTHNLGMCPDQESNSQPFGVWDNAPKN